MNELIKSAANEIKSSPQAAQKGMQLKQRPELVTVPLVFALFICGWEFTVRYFKIEAFILPGPIDIGQELIQGLSSGIFLKHFRVTLIEILSGFSLGATAGILTGSV